MYRSYYHATEPCNECMPPTAICTARAVFASRRSLRRGEAVERLLVSCRCVLRDRDRVRHYDRFRIRRYRVFGSEVYLSSSRSRLVLQVSQQSYCTVGSSALARFLLVVVVAFFGGSRCLWFRSCALILVVLVGCMDEYANITYSH